MRYLQQDSSSRAGKRRVAAVAAALAAAAAAALAGTSTGAQADLPQVSAALAQAVKADPDKTFDVIIQGDAGEHSDKLVQRVGGRLARALGSKGPDRKLWFDGLRDQFEAINGVSVSIGGRELAKLLRTSGITAVTLDAPVHLAGVGNTQKWVESVGAKWYWGSPQLRAGQLSLNAPTIAVIDSGVQPLAGDLAGRLLPGINLAWNAGNTPAGDGYGHGTMVAGIAAGSSLQHAGVNPAARILPVDVVDDNGRANTSDVIRALDWVLSVKDIYNVKVVNLSLAAEGASSFRWDPLDKAVERLWFAGVTVVASAGNYGKGATSSGVPLAPANDPFVITVGAIDTQGTGPAGDDAPAPWTAWGYTADGFAKPELAAPGRYMIGPIPGTSSKLGRDGGQDRRLVPQGYLKLSGTSFAAPVVSGIVAALIAAHPDWSPDQVKGALMAGATSLKGSPAAAGVGEANLQKSIGLAVPPNPNLALRAFVRLDSGGRPAFDEASWAAAAQASASWSSASWSSASWSSASWSSASWSSASWSSMSETDASWSSSAGGDGNGDA